MMGMLAMGFSHRSAVRVVRSRGGTLMSGARFGGSPIPQASRLESFDKDLVLPHLEERPCRILIGESTLHTWMINLRHNQ